MKKKNKKKIKNKKMTEKDHFKKDIVVLIVDQDLVTKNIIDPEVEVLTNIGPK